MTSMRPVKTRKKTTQHARMASSLTGTASKKDTPRAGQKLQNALFFSGGSWAEGMDDFQKFKVLDSQSYRTNAKKVSK